ncbi:MAG: glycoside hydrolase family 10 protein [Cyanobium sp.]
MAPLRRRARLTRHLPVSLTLALTALLQLAGLLEPPAAARARPQPQTSGRLPEPITRRVGVWLTNSPSPLYYDAARLDAAVQQLAHTGFNTLYPNVWSRGATFHRSRWAPIEPALAQSAPGLDPICRLTRSAQRRGMQVVPWFEYGLMEPGDAEVVRRNPEWILRRADGSALYAMHGANLKTSPLKDLRVWLNPAHPGVRQRFIGLITEIVQRCGVDGIQLDDHFAWPVDLGYDDYTRALYRAETGREPPASPTDRAWMKWRRTQLTNLLRELRASLDRASSGKRTVISLSPGPFRFAYNHWLQDWELWALGHLIDDLVVQNYAYSVKGFEKDLNQPALVKARSWGLPVEIGLLAGFGGRTPDMATLAEKVRLSAERGHGVIYFYWEGLWGQYARDEGPEYRREAFRQLHRQAFGPAAGAEGRPLILPPRPATVTPRPAPGPPRTSTPPPPLPPLP